MKRINIIALILLINSLAVSAQKYVFQNPDLPTEVRLDSLLAQLTLEEKVMQLVYTSPAIERLGIPPYNWWNESLHGVARAGLATVFPQAIAMAAAFDEPMMKAIGTAISDEARAKYNDFIRRNKHGIYQGLTFWTPNINIFRDPRWGRGQETYGEDPFLTGRLAVNFIQGMQGNDPKYLKTVATAKHFAVHSGPEPLRHEFEAKASDKDLWETYLPAFEMSVNEGKVRSVMCAYNSYRGEACCGSNLLLKDVLRKKWNFDGYVVSDCGAIRDIWEGHKTAKNAAEASAQALLAGTDLNCGSAYPALIDAVKQGIVDESVIDRAVRRLFKARFDLGMFDPDSYVKYAQIPMSAVDSKEHRELALEAARKSIVLLKNDKLLPIGKTVKKIAVIGPVADDDETLWGNYCGYNKSGVTVLQGIKNKLPQAKVKYEVGCELSEGFPQLEVIPAQCIYTDKQKKSKGFEATYFDNVTLDGNPKVKQTNPEINFTWWDEAPHNLNPDGFSARWEGYVEAPEAGKFALGCEGLYGFKMWVNDSLWFNYYSVHHPRKMFKHLNLRKGELVKIKIEYVHQKVNHALMKLYWALPMTPQVQKRAIDAARNADLVVLCLGFNQNMEGEEMNVKVDGFAGGDRTDVVLPKTQRELIRKIHEQGKPVVLVLLNGSPVSTTWEDEHIPAIIEGWYGGQSAGTAIADVIFGDYNPSGRMPVTVYKSLDNLPAFDNYDMKGRTYRYYKDTPLYEFGYGLSYTTYAYSDLKLPASVPTDGKLQVSASVSNTGNMGGDEVIQLYITNRNTKATVPLRSLQGFKHIYLKPGETKNISFTLDAGQLAFVNEYGERVIAPGEIDISIGGGQPSAENLNKQNVVKGSFVLTGKEIRF